MSFKLLVDNALDVDSDVRFMALEDFKKLIIKENAAEVEGFIPTLYKLLNDPNADVKSQTIKVFPLLMPVISDDKIIETFVTVFDNRADSVWFLVLKVMMNTNRFTKSLSRSLIVQLLPATISNDDVSLEILIEMIRNLGGHFVLSELTEISTFLIKVSFTAKKAVYAFELLLDRELAVPGDVVDQWFAMINDNMTGNTDFGVKNVGWMLVLIIVKSFDNLHYKLPNTDELTARINQVLDNDTEGLDYDEVVEDNLLKELCLDILGALTNYHIPVTNIIEKFLVYDPLGTDDTYSEDLFDLEDNDDDDGYEEENDGSWKLRLKLIVLIHNLKDRRFLGKLIDMMDERNDAIFNQVLVTVTMLLSHQDEALVPQIETKVATNLTTKSLLAYTSLIDKVISVNLQLSPQFIQDVFRFLNNNPKTFILIEVLHILGRIVATNDISTIKDELAIRLCEEMAQNRASVVNAIVPIFKQLPGPNERIYRTLLTKLNDAKLSIDIKVQVLDCLTHYVMHNAVDLQEVAAVYIPDRNEMTIKPMLTNLNQLFSPGNINYRQFLNNSQFCHQVADVAASFLSTNNKLVMTLVVQLFQNMRVPIPISELDRLKPMMDDASTINLVLDTLLLVDLGPEDIERLINVLNGLEYDNDIVLEPLMRHIATPNVLEQFQSACNNALMAKCVCELTLVTKSYHQIQKGQSHVTQCIENQQYNEKFLLTLEYLGFVGLQHPVDLEIGRVLQILSSDASDNVKYNVARSLGKLMAPGELIQQFLNQQYRPYILYTIQVFVKSHEDLEFNTQITQILLEEVNVSKITKEFQIIGDILSISMDPRQLSTLLDLPNHSLGMEYTLLVTINYLLKLEDVAITEKLVLQTLPFQKTVNLDVKLMFIKNLIGLVYQSPQSFNSHKQIFMDTIVDESRLYPEFQKVIPMGPYKYVIDEGLEIRKVVFELIYLIMDNAFIDVDYLFLIATIVDKGLADKEHDIIQLSFINLTKLVDMAPEFLNSFDNLQLLVERLSVLLHRKLLTKATNQEVDNYNESLRSLVQFSTQANDIMSRNEWSFSNWQAYFDGVVHMRR